MPGLLRHWEGNLNERLSSLVLRCANCRVSIRLSRWTDTHAPNLVSCYLHKFSCNQSFDVKKLIRAVIILNIDIDIISLIIRVGKKEICSGNFTVDTEGALGKGVSVLSYFRENLHISSSLPAHQESQNEENMEQGWCLCHTLIRTSHYPKMKGI